MQDTIVRVADQSEVGAARRAAVSLAERLGFSDTGAGRIAIAVTELATNLVRHGGGGELILRESPDGVPAIEVVALDRGPGIVNLAEALRDGFSTAGSPGEGLGAVARQADHWELFTLPGNGTVALARFARVPSPGGQDRLVVGGVSIPHPGEEVCGDAWSFASHAGRTAIIVADGLGHGPAAAEASAAALQAFDQHRDAEPGAILEAAHDALRATRGAALGVADVRPDRGTLIFAGVGNIAGAIITGTAARRLVSHAGIVGHQCRKIQEYTHPWEPGALLILHSDGLQTHWQLERYPGLAMRHPTVIAATLYRDRSRGRDDVTVVAARERA